MSAIYSSMAGKGFTNGNEGRNVTDGHTHTQIRLAKLSSRQMEEKDTLHCSLSIAIQIT